MTFFSSFRTVLAVLLLGVALACTACGSSGSNEEDDGKFPEPPDRPNVAAVAQPGVAALGA